MFKKWRDKQKFFGTMKYMEDDLDIFFGNWQERAQKQERRKEFREAFA